MEGHPEVKSVKPNLPRFSSAGFAFNWLYPFILGNPFWGVLLVLFYVLFILAGYAAIYSPLYYYPWLALPFIYLLFSVVLGIWGPRLVWHRRCKVSPEAFWSEQKLADTVALYALSIALSIGLLAFIISRFFFAYWQIVYSFAGSG